MSNDPFDIQDIINSAKMPPYLERKAAEGKTEDDIIQEFLLTADDMQKLWASKKLDISVYEKIANRHWQYSFNYDLAGGEITKEDVDELTSMNENIKRYSLTELLEQGAVGQSSVLLSKETLFHIAAQFGISAEERVSFDQIIHVLQSTEYYKELKENNKDEDDRYASLANEMFAMSVLAILMQHHIIKEYGTLLFAISSDLPFSERKDLEDIIALWTRYYQRRERKKHGHPLMQMLRGIVCVAAAFVSTPLLLNLVYNHMICSGTSALSITGYILYGVILVAELAVTAVACPIRGDDYNDISISFETMGFGGLAAAALLLVWHYAPTQMNQAFRFYFNATKDHYMNTDIVYWFIVVLGFGFFLLPTIMHMLAFKPKKRLSGTIVLLYSGFMRLILILYSVYIIIHYCLIFNLTRNVIYGAIVAIVCIMFLYADHLRD